MILIPALVASAYLTTSTVHASLDFPTRDSPQPAQDAGILATIQPTPGKLAQAFVDQLMVPAVASTTTRSSNLPYQFLLNGSTSNYDTIMSTFGYASLDPFDLVALLPVKQDSTLHRFMDTVAGHKVALTSPSTVYAKALSGKYKITSPDRLQDEFLRVGYEGLRTVVTMNDTQYTAVQTNATLQTNATDLPSFTWSDSVSGASYQIVFTSDLNDAGDTIETSFTGQITYAGSNQIASETFAGKIAPFDPREIIPAQSGNLVKRLPGDTVAIAVPVGTTCLSGFVTWWRKRSLRAKVDATNAGRPADAQAADIEYGAANRRAESVDVRGLARKEALRIVGGRLVSKQWDEVLKARRLIRNQDYNQMVEQRANEGVAAGIGQLKSERLRNNVRSLDRMNPNTYQLDSDEGRSVKAVANTQIEVGTDSYVGTHMDAEAASQMQALAEFSTGGTREGRVMAREARRGRVHNVLNDQDMQSNNNDYIGLALYKQNGAYNEEMRRKDSQKSATAVIEYRDARAQSKKRKDALKTLQKKLEKANGGSPEQKARERALQREVEAATNVELARKRLLDEANQDIREGRIAFEKREREAKELRERVERSHENPEV